MKIEHPELELSTDNKVHPVIKQDWFSDQFKPSRNHYPQHILFEEFTRLYPRMQAIKFVFYVGLLEHFGEGVSRINGTSVSTGYFLEYVRTEPQD